MVELFLAPRMIEHIMVLLFCRGKKCRKYFLRRYGDALSIFGRGDTHGWGKDKCHGYSRSP